MLIGIGSDADWLLVGGVSLSQAQAKLTGLSVVWIRLWIDSWLYRLESHT